MIIIERFTNSCYLQLCLHPCPHST